MNAEFTSQLPDQLNRIELGTIRRQEIQPQFPFVIPQPGLQESGVMISGVIQNDHHLLVGGTMAKEMFQEFSKGLPVEFVPLLCYQSAFPQTDGSEHPDLFVCRSMPEDRIFEHRKGSTSHIEIRVAGNDTHPNSKGQGHLFPSTDELFLYASWSSGLAPAIIPRGLRRRNPRW